MHKTIDFQKIFLWAQLIYFTLFEFYKVRTAPHFYYSTVDFKAEILGYEQQTNEFIYTHSRFVISLVEILVIYVFAFQNCDIIRQLIDEQSSFQKK